MQLQIPTNKKIITPDDRLISTAFSIGAPPTELNGVQKNEDGSITLGARASGTGETQTLEANIWLPRAAEYHGLSKNINDYILVPVPAMITDFPNTNGDSVSLQEFTAWNDDQGRMTYKTWTGRPMYVEHQHKPEWVRGLILDTYLRPTQFRDVYTLIMLAALDRTRDPVRCDRVLKRELNTYSMGMYYSAYACSICNHMAGKGIGAPCAHTRPRKPTYKLLDGRLAYRRCMGITGFELSLLENLGGRSGLDGYRTGFGDPSYVSAIGDTILDPRALK